MDGHAGSGRCSRKELCSARQLLLAHAPLSHSLQAPAAATCCIKARFRMREYPCLGRLEFCYASKIPSHGASKAPVARCDDHSWQLCPLITYTREDAAQLGWASMPTSFCIATGSRDSKEQAAVSCANSLQRSTDRGLKYVEATHLPCKSFRSSHKHSQITFCVSVMHSTWDVILFDLAHLQQRSADLTSSVLGTDKEGEESMVGPVSA